MTTPQQTLADRMEHLWNSIIAAGDAAEKEFDHQVARNFDVIVAALRASTSAREESDDVNNMSADAMAVDALEPLRKLQATDPVTYGVTLRRVIAAILHCRVKSYELGAREATADRMRLRPSGRGGARDDKTL
jgi:hypothetical protein